MTVPRWARELLGHPALDSAQAIRETVRSVVLPLVTQAMDEDGAARRETLRLLADELVDLARRCRALAGEGGDDDDTETS